MRAEGVPAHVMVRIVPLASTDWIVIVKSFVLSAPPRSEPGITIVSVAEYPDPAPARKTFA